MSGGGRNGATPGSKRGRGGAAERPVPNAEIARLLREVADLLDVQGENPFRIRAYRTAARVIDELPWSVHDVVIGEGLDRIDALPGIGPDLAGKIGEIARTGTLAALRELEDAVPPTVAELMHIPGVGPKKARALMDQLGVRTTDDLRRAAETGRIREIKGFGAKTEEKILRELRLSGGEPSRVLRATAAQYGEALVDWLRATPGVERVEIAGSFRRCKETVGDLDILVTCRSPARAIERFVAYPDVDEVLAQGPTKASVRLRSHLQVDVRVLAAESFGAGLHYFTGSKAHNIAVRAIGRKSGLKVNEYGVFRGKKRIAGRSEEEVFASVGLPWIPPELREDRGEIQAALAGTLPELIRPEDVRGDLQMHTPDSDGRDELEGLAEAAEGLGYEYIAVTDHTPALSMIQGLDAAGFRRQGKRIERLNAKLGKLRVLRGAEVEIHPDGTLDLADAALEALDFVVASIHSAFDLSSEAQTERVLRALQNPCVDVLGHPTGRRIGRRRPMALDLEKVVQAAADNGVMLELNAQPERLDLDDVASHAAAERGVKIVISSDAHSVAELRFMRWGVDQARRAWLRRADVANTRPLQAFMKLLHEGRR
jgi:DNA polymerase (family 10)